MQVGGYVTVRCSPPCDKPAGPVDVPVERVAPGVLARPALECENCGKLLQTVSERKSGA